MRELRCKVGDLAIVTKCDVPERIGLIIKVIGPGVDGKHDWLTELRGRGVWARDLHTRKMRFCGEMLCHDWNLTPIRGTPIDTDFDATEPNQYDDCDFRRFLINLQSLSEKEAA